MFSVQLRPRSSYALPIFQQKRIDRCASNDHGSRTRLMVTSEHEHGEETMTTLRIATWNVENFFKPVAGAPQAAQAAYDAKIPLLAERIAAVDPDIVALQEVGGDDALADLQIA